MIWNLLTSDITADEKLTAKYIEKKIKHEVENYLYKHPFIKKTDILKVVQIIDTDGAFVPRSLVKQSENEKTEYFETHIQAKNMERLVRRNISNCNMAVFFERLGIARTEEETPVEADIVPPELS